MLVEPDVKKTILTLPLSFLGLGFWRAWLVLYNGFLSNATGTFGIDAFDIVFSCFLILAALNTHRLAPLCEKPKVIAASVLLIAAGTLLCLPLGSTLLAGFECAIGASPMAFAAPSIALAALGSTVLLLSWCELYSCLGTFRILLFLVLSFALDAIISGFSEGLPVNHLIALVIALPILSWLCFWRANASLPETNQSRFPGNALALPWKLIALLAVYEFAFGLRAQQMSIDLASYSNISSYILVGLLAVYLLFFVKSLRFSVIYHTPLLLIVCALLLVPIFGNNIAAFTVSFSSQVFEIVVFLLLCDISKRMGIAAVALFGFEEATVMFRSFGREAAALFPEYLGVHPEGVGTASTVAILAIVAIATFLLCNEKELKARWGITFMASNTPFEKESETARLMFLCKKYGEECGLTQREQEVFQLMAYGKSADAICRELFIAKGTMKAHTSHIYSKLGVHTRKEMNALLAKPVEPEIPTEQERRNS